MKVVLDPTVNTPAGGAPASPVSRSTPRVSTAARKSSTPAQQTTEAAAQPSTVTSELQASVTFRRDAAGQIYYVVTDSNTGKELRQVPPEAVRKAGEGIAEFLKQEEEKAKGSSHLEIKA